MTALGSCNNNIQNACPSSGGWTLSGSTCTRADCPADQMRDPATDACVPSCASRSNTNQSSGFYDIGTSASGSPVTYGCTGGCSVIFSGSSPAGTSVVGGVRRYYAKGFYSYDGSTCTAGTSPSTSSAAVPADSCAANQTKGTINGQVVCVDNATKTPVNTGTAPATSTTGTISSTDAKTGATTTQTTATASDGSTAITTTTCASAGNCTSNTQIIPNANGGTGASSLVPKADTPTDYQRDATGTTTNTRLSEIKEILSPTGALPDTSLSTSGTAFADAETAIDNGIKAVGDRAQSNLGGLLSWDWKPDIPTANCQPFTLSFAGKTQTLDWCDKIAWVRDIFGYALYILTAWGLFNIVTANKREGVA